jgi:hypothetical protein
MAQVKDQLTVYDQSGQKAAVPLGRAVLEHKA